MYKIHKKAVGIHVIRVEQSVNRVVRYLINNSYEYAHMKKNPSKTESEDDLEEILKQLEISSRTQQPPSEDLIKRLNEIASKPPFTYIHKAKKNDPR